MYNFVILHFSPTFPGGVSLNVPFIHYLFIEVLIKQYLMYIFQCQALIQQGVLGKSVQLRVGFLLGTRYLKVQA